MDLIVHGAKARRCYDRIRRECAPPIGLGLGLGITNSGAAKSIAAIFGSDLVMLADPSIASSVTQSGGTVSVLADISGVADTNRDWVQATGAKQLTFNSAPAGFNGNSTISKTGGGAESMQSRGVWAASYATPYTIFVIGSYTGDANTRYAYTTLSGTDNGLFVAPTTKNLGVDGAANYSFGAPPLTTANFMGALFNGGSSKLWLNAKTPVTGNTGAVQNLGAVKQNIGNYQDSLLQWIGHYALIVGVKASPTTQQVSDFADLCASRFAITIGA